MMRSVLPPLCLVVALATLIAGFAVLRYGAPEASTELHRVRSSGDEEPTQLRAEVTRQAYEIDLLRDAVPELRLPLEDELRRWRGHRNFWDRMLSSIQRSQQRSRRSSLRSVVGSFLRETARTRPSPVQHASHK